MLAIIYQKHNINNINLKSKIKFFAIFWSTSSLFQRKITASVTKSLYQDRGPCYLHLHIFFLYIHSTLLLENKNFPQQIRPQTTV